MTSLVSILVDAAIVVTLFIGFAQFRAPRGARRGNYTAAAAVAFAVAVVLIRSGVSYPVVVVAALAAGALAGWIVAADEARNKGDAVAAVGALQVQGEAAHR